MSIYDFLDKNNIPYKNKDLINQAFTHTSYANENKLVLGDNERLEFIGDAVLQIYTAENLYKHKPELSEGVMSLKRASLVSEKALSKFAIDFHLNDYLLLGQGEIKNNGKFKDSIVSDMFEAFIGAIYLDQGQVVTYRLLDILMKGSFDEVDDSIYDYKTKLQEYVQADSRKEVVYETVSVHGPNNNPTFEVVVKIDGLVYGRAQANSKKQAQKLAAKSALEKMVK